MRRALGEYPYFVQLEAYCLPLIRVSTGQIGNYMIELELKHGFLTNFDQTYFLKREIVNGAEVLYCFPPVPHDASALGPDGVSIRQCLLLLQSSVVGDESAWKTEKTSDSGIIKKNKGEKMGEAKRRAGDALNNLGGVAGSAMDAVSGQFEGLSMGTAGRRTRFDEDPVTREFDPPSRLSTLRPRRR